MCEDSSNETSLETMKFGCWSKSPGLNYGKRDNRKVQVAGVDVRYIEND